MSQRQLNIATLERRHPLTIAPPPDPAPLAVMRPSASVQDYTENPIGRYILGSTYLVWYRSAGLSGMVFWGQPEPEHIAAVISSIDIDGDGTPRASLVDARRVKAIGPEALDMMAAYLGSRHTQLKRRISAQAVLRQDGLVGAAVAGFHRVFSHPYPVEVFTDPYEALAWLGASHQKDVVPEVDRIVDSIGDVPSTVRALRACLRENLGRSFSLQEAAAYLGLSTRSLQRKLRGVKSSFRAEQNNARVQSAKRLLLDTNYDIKRVALEVGCQSASNFNVLFRKVLGQTPCTWRSRIRSGASRQATDLGG